MKFVNKEYPKTFEQEKKIARYDLQIANHLVIDKIRNK